MYIDERLIGSIVEFKVNEKVTKGTVIMVFSNRNDGIFAILLDNGEIITKYVYDVKLVKKGSGKHVKKITRPELMDLK